MITSKKTVITLEGNDELEIRVPDKDGEITSIEIARGRDENGKPSVKEGWTVLVDRDDLHISCLSGELEDPEDIGAGMTGNKAIILL